MEPVLVVTIILLFASSVIVDGLVHAAGHLLRMVDDRAHRPVVYGGATARNRPARARLVHPIPAAVSTLRG